MEVTDGVEEVSPQTGSNEENIFVSVRLRPLNSKEILRNDVSDWECIDENTIIYKNTYLSPSERSMYPTSYTFDRVFSAESSTRQVYKEGAKQVALSVVNGVNSSIFAYGQTSSGKTYTMTGITEYSIADIYDYVQKHTERDFILKFSAMEIYNESVRDLLSIDTTPLRLLDDPERGTIVEKLTEETIRDWNHVIELLSICEAQRQIGETSLNETSSRSHQIIRLTIESSARELLGKDNSSTLMSTVNFVDLAGSERASQTLSAGTRLKEGCHINRSLLTLGTVIRKLSKGRNGHIPYRDSKLTRILQSSLGGNARTAIICTMSPARSHVEQSRNTLLFASCAKEVTTDAQVNIVVSDKALVKHLQRELTRLQTELKNPGSSFDESRYAALLHEKDAQIEKLEKELKDVTLERDLAQSQVQNLIQLISEDENLSTRIGLGKYPNLRVRISPDSLHIVRGEAPSIHSQASFRTFGTSRSSDQQSRTSSEDNCVHIPDFEETYTHTGPSAGLFVGDLHFSESDLDEVEQQSTASSEDLCKDIACTEEYNVKSQSCLTPSKVNPDYISAPIAVVNGESDDVESVLAQQDEGQLACDLVNEDKKVDESMVKNDRDFSIINFNNSLVCYEKQSPWYEGATDMSSSRSSNLWKSQSCKASFMVDPLSHWIEKIQNNEGMPPNGSEKELIGGPQGPQRKFSSLSFGTHDGASLSKEQYKSSHDTVCNHAIEEQNPKASDTDGIKEIAMIQEDSRCVENQSKEHGETKNKSIRSVKDVGLDPIEEVAQSTSDWPNEFKRLQRKIIQLWDECYVPLVHRAHFFLLFKGDPSDSIYMEVELRRLSFLKECFSRGKVVQDGKTFTLDSSLKALRRERQMLSKQMQKKLSEEERESLYLKWDVRVNSKNRRLQVVERLWSDTGNMEHITDSAILVAKLTGLVQPEQAPKEMFALNFSPALSTRTWSIKSSLISLL